MQSKIRLFLAAAAVGATALLFGTVQQAAQAQGQCRYQHDVTFGITSLAASSCADQGLTGVIVLAQKQWLTSTKFHWVAVTHVAIRGLKREERFMQNGCDTKRNDLGSNKAVFAIVSGDPNDYTVEQAWIVNAEEQAIYPISNRWVVCIAPGMRR